MKDDLQSPDGLDQPVTGLRGRAGPTREHCSSGGLRVGRVRLALEPSRLTVGTVDFDHLDAFGAQEPQQAGSVAAGRLDPHLVELAPDAQPLQQTDVAGGGRGERGGAQVPSDSRVQRGHHVQVAVGDSHESGSTGSYEVTKPADHPGTCGGPA